MTIIGMPPAEVRQCGWCGSDQRGPLVVASPDDVGRADGRPRYYSRTFSVKIPGQYDGGLFFECPDCGNRWHRWPEEDFRYRRAVPYVLDAQRRCVRGANAPVGGLVQ